MKNIINGQLFSFRKKKGVITTNSLNIKMIINTANNSKFDNLYKLD